MASGSRLPHNGVPVTIDNPLPDSCIGLWVGNEGDVIADMRGGAVNLPFRNVQGSLPGRFAVVKAGTTAGEIIAFLE